jgi:hypothetical protein
VSLAGARSDDQYDAGAQYRERHQSLSGLDLVIPQVSITEPLIGVLIGVASFLLPKVTVGFPGNYRVPFKFPLLKQGVATPDF